MTYGEKIAYLRKSNGMTQEDLGKVLSVTYQAVSKWERGESLPDFTTMSQIAKFFMVPLSYFEEDGEIAKTPIQEQPPIAVTNNYVNYVGTCTVCGRMIKEDDEYVSSPKLICKSCAEIAKQQKQEQEVAAARKRKYQKEQAIYEQCGSGFDAKLIISIALAAVCYIVFSILTFSSENLDGDVSLYALLLMFVPLAIFALVHVIADFISDLRSCGDDGPEGYTRNLSLIVGAVFAVINLVLFITIYSLSGYNSYYLILIFGSTISSFTFISQYMWGSVVREIFSCGGFTFKMPGFIFSLTIESIIWMIVTKILLGFLSILIFLATTVLFAVIAMAGSVFTFIPCLISKTVKDRRVIAEN